MKIAYILPSLRNSAPIKVMHLLCSKMVEHGHECEVFYLDEILSGEAGLNFPCKIKHVGKMFREIRLCNYDIVHSTGIRPDIFLSLHKKSGLKPKFVSTIHSFFLEDFTSSHGILFAKFWGFIWMNALSRLDHVITLSRVGIKYYSKYILNEKLEFAYNSIPDIEKETNVDSAFVEKLLKFRGDGKLMACHANLLSIKGIDIAIKALMYLSNIKLVILGDGKEKDRLMQLAVDYGISERVLWGGFKQDAWLYLRYYDVYVIPSRSEGFPLVLLEAARARVPTVCSDIPTFNELFTSDEITFFNLNDPRSLAEAINYSITHPKKADLFKKKYQNYYMAEDMYIKYLKIYERKV